MRSRGINMKNLVLYETENGQTKLEVHLQEDTLWLTQAQLAELFDVNVPAISKHVSNIIKSGELDPDATISKMEKVQWEGDRKVRRKQVSYNLDMIISIGYRVNSSKATRFRIWSTHVLRDHLVQGYTLNEQRLHEEQAKLQEMKRAIDLLARTLEQQQLVKDAGQDVLRVITDYAYALATLDRYDHGTLEVEATSGPASFVLEYDEAIKVVLSMKDDFSGLFGQEKDQGFKSALGAVYQTFDGKDVYPSIEEKAANLLYFVVKNHAFTDGNKRIAAAIFIFFLARNGILYREDGSKRLADNLLVALTLLIAESKPEEKDTLVKVVVNLINRNNG